MTDTTPKHPGKILFDQVMTPLGVSRNKLARDIDVPVGRISDIVAGKRGVTPDTALRFAKYFGTTAELWLRLQADYDLYVARTTTWLDSEPKVAEFEPAGDAGVSAGGQAAPDPAPANYPREVNTAVPANDGAAAMPENGEQPVAGSETTPDASAIVTPGVSVDSSPAATEDPLSTVSRDDEDIDIPEPLTAGMNRPEAG